MIEADDTLNGYIELAARLLKIEIRPEWLPSIRANLEVTLAQAAAVQAFNLRDDAEPAPVFEA